MKSTKNFRRHVNCQSQLNPNKRHCKAVVWNVKKTGRGCHFFHVNLSSFEINLTFAHVLSKGNFIQMIASLPNDCFSFKTTVICANISYCNLFSIVYCLHVDGQTLRIARQVAKLDCNVQVKDKSEELVDFVDR